LGALAMQPEIVVPALTNGLTHPKYQVRAAAAAALGVFGLQASSAAPGVLTLLTDTNRDVRKVATNTLLKIAPEALTNALSK
jgi:HEAT repeat protein